MTKPTKTPWGRPIIESASGSACVTTPWGRDAPTTSVPTYADFREVGLSESDAKASAEGLAAGRYLSFEDACYSRPVFGAPPLTLDQRELIRKKALKFIGISEND